MSSRPLAMELTLTTKDLVRAALIAALYAGITLLAAAVPALGALSFGPIQIRFSEALTVLPFFTPAAVPGLTLGCLISNLIGTAAGLGGGLPDAVLGTAATLLAALLSRRIKKEGLVPLPPVVLNALLLPLVLSPASGIPYSLCALTVAIGQLGACYGIGFPLLKLLKRYPKLFK